MIVYGIKNCSTVKKALNWLDEHQITYEFHDYKKLSISAEKLQEWTVKLDWEQLLNKRGTSWRKIDPAIQAKIVDSDSAINLMLQQNSLIKRPIIESEKGLILGFDENIYQEKILNL